MTEALLLFLLIAASGVFSVAEMAIGASRTVRLQALADQGHAAARTVLTLREKPSRLLAATQLALTVLAMVSGVVGESLWVARAEALIVEHLPSLTAIKYPLSLTVVMLLITFVSLVAGEVVPKRIALAHPERVAMALSPAVSGLLRLTAPVVAAVSAVSEWLLRRLPASASLSEETRAADEIRVLVEMGSRAGDLTRTEGKLIDNVFRLDDQRVAAIMTPATDIRWLDADAPDEDNVAVLRDSSYSRYPLCRDGLHNVLGLVESREALARLLEGEPLSPASLTLQPAKFVPSVLSLSGLLEFFRNSRTTVALVVNEFGVTEGLVTVSDLLGTMVGDVLPEQDPLAVQREDGSWLLDGLLPIGDLRGRLGLELPDDELGSCHTLGGFVLYRLGRIPRKAERFEAGDWVFEVVDMDRNRVDEVLARRRLPG